MALIKHSTRTLRHPCRKCGAVGNTYWAHDTEQPTGTLCKDCNGVDGKWVMTERDGTLHACFTDRANNQSPVNGDLEANPAPIATPAPAPTPSPVPDDRMGALAALLDLLAPKVDASQVHSIVDERLRGLVLPVQVEVKRDGIIRKVEGLAHKILPTVIKRLARKRHVLLVGPAGTGKSHILTQAAEALGIEHGSISLTAQTPASAIAGYMTATGEYVRTVFRDRFEHGGMFVFDEVDAGHPNVLGLVNSALANGSMAFPDGMVKRHDNFRCGATANTYGRGADRAYVGRQALDLAFTDRFTIITVDYDEALEEALCLGTGLDGTRVKAALSWIRHLRKQADTYKMPLGFGTRRAEALCDALADGFTVGEAVEMEVRRGISDADWRKIHDGAPALY